jgi:hypothetical protein
VGLVRRAPARHPGLGRRYEAQDVLFTHRCSSS